MNQKQTDITTGKQIRHLRTQSGMTQEELAGELNVTRQALSNWERDVNEPDLNTLKKICFLFGVHMDDFAKEVITKMETYEKKEKRQFNKYDMAIGLFYGVGIFLGIGIFFVGRFVFTPNLRILHIRPRDYNHVGRLYIYMYCLLLRNIFTNNGREIIDFNR